MCNTQRVWTQYIYTFRTRVQGFGVSNEGNTNSKSPRVASPLRSLGLNWSYALASFFDIRTAVPLDGKLFLQRLITTLPSRSRPQRLLMFACACWPKLHLTGQLSSLPAQVRCLLSLSLEMR